MSTWKVILATLVIYCAGLVTGALIVRSSPGKTARETSPPGWVFQGPDFVQQRFLDRMEQELKLTTEQSKRLAAIFHDARERMKSWWEIVSPEMQTELREVREKIQKELNPEQREKFEKLLKERHRPPGGPSPGERRPREHRSNSPRNAAQSPGTNLQGEAPTSL